MDSRVSESLSTHRSLGRNVSVQDLRRKLSALMRLLQDTLDKPQVADLIKYYKTCQLLLEREEKKPQSGINTALFLEQARLEKKIATRNEKESIRTTEYEEKEEDLKDKLDVHHDKIIENEKNKNNALLDNFVKDTSLDIQARAKEAEVRSELEVKQSSCWWSFFCCGTIPSELKQKKNDLITIQHDLLENRAAVPAVMAKADADIAKLNSDREKVLLELDKLAKSRVTLYDSDSDADENRLADVKFLIEQTKKNQSHLLSIETLMSCMRFYECALFIMEHLPEDDGYLADDPASPLVTYDARHHLMSYIGDEDSILLKLFKTFYSQDADGLTTTFGELRDAYNELARHLPEEKRIELLAADDLQQKLMGDTPLPSFRA